VVLVSCRISWV